MEEMRVTEEGQPKSGKRIKWWPHHILKLAFVFVFVVAAIVYLANQVPVPYRAPEMVPLPDEGENIPGPEWLFLLFWQGFWFFTGTMKKYLPLMPLGAIAAFVLMFFLPFYHKIPLAKIPGLGGLMRAVAGMKSGIKKSFLYALPVIVVGLAFSFAVYKSGHQAKVLGCDSCHNPAMGPRQAIPPADVAKYYAVDRARQIGVGKYRAGKTVSDEAGSVKVVNPSETQGYKDADWQMRHMYEPTFTW